MKIMILKDSIIGRGVFAKETIESGELIETCELILLDPEEVHKTLEGYVYQFSQNKVAVALGNGSLLNHADKANSEFYFNYQKRLPYIKARRDTDPGKEITTNYGYDKDSKKNSK